MNNRIFELAKQATRQYSPTYYTQEWIQGFAELIIQECLLAISQTPIESDEIGTMVRCHNQVEQHFGVEE
jgi:hypothetical protein